MKVTVKTNNQKTISVNSCDWLCLNVSTSYALDDGAQWNPHYDNLFSTFLTEKETGFIQIKSL